MAKVIVTVCSVVFGLFTLGIFHALYAYCSPKEPAHPLNTDRIVHKVSPPHSPVISSRGTDLISDSIFILSSKEEKNGEERKEIGQLTINAMSEFFNKHPNIMEGIWYPDDFEKLFNSKQLTMPESYWTGYSNNKYFRKTGPWSFELQKGTKPSEGLLSFLKGPTVADCGNAVEACQLKAILDYLGEDKFNELFSSEFTLTIGNSGTTGFGSFGFYFFDHSDKGAEREFFVGEVYYFGGVKECWKKHPNGHRGWFVVYIGNNEEGHPLFMGHGFERPMTEEEITKKLVELYNQDSKDKNIDESKREHQLSIHEVLANPRSFVSGFSQSRSINIEKLRSLKEAENVIKATKTITVNQYSQFGFTS